MLGSKEKVRSLNRDVDNYVRDSYYKIIAKIFKVKK
jgi:hypothetical protein